MVFKLCLLLGVIYLEKISLVKFPVLVLSKEEICTWICCYLSIFFPVAYVFYCAGFIYIPRLNCRPLDLKCGLMFYH